MCVCVCAFNNEFTPAVNDAKGIWLAFVAYDVFDSPQTQKKKN